MRPAVSGTIGPTGNSEDIECGQQTGEYAVAFFMRQSPRLLLGERAVDPGAHRLYERERPPKLGFAKAHSDRVEPRRSRLALGLGIDPRLPVDATFIPSP